MWNLFLERFAEDPWWIGGCTGLMVIIFFLLLFSFFRNVRSLAWFYGASLIIAGIMNGVLYWFPAVLEVLISYRSDWSLVFLVQNVTFMTLLTQVIFFILVYSLVSFFVMMALGLWSLLTFRWQRLKIVLHRSLSQSWHVVFFAVMTVVMNFLAGVIIAQLNLSHLLAVFQLILFLFVLQFFLRMVDNAYLHTPKLFLEYVYTTGLLMLFFRFLFDWMSSLSSQQFFVKSLFLNQLFSFFLVVLLLGLMGTFFVRALFASAFFLDHYHRRTTLMKVWTSRLMVSARDRSYSGQRILIGIFLSLAMGFVFLMMILIEWYLLFIPVLFLGYFFLFLLLDRQDDMRVSGDLVDKRIESAVNKVFFS